MKLQREKKNEHRDSPTADVHDEGGSGEDWAGIDYFIDRCTSCGTCTAVCAFLKSHGTPDTIIARGGEDVFLCTSCGACNEVCPAGLSPREAFTQAKSRLIVTGRVSREVLRTIRSSIRFARTGHSLPFAYYPTSETVFWPGCALAGARPDIVNRAAELLSRQFKTRVEVVLDCCFDPAYQVGDLTTVQDTAQRIAGRFRKHGITRVITGCANCQKIFAHYLPQVRSDHIIEVLSEKDFRILPDKEYYLHHPCPSYRSTSLQRTVKRHVSDQGIELEEPSHATCCGLGGGTDVLASEKSHSFTHEIIASSGSRPILTYCMGCKENFLKRGKISYHLLEFIMDTPPVVRRIYSIGKWTNRLLLSASYHIKRLLPFYTKHNQS